MNNKIKEPEKDQCFEARIQPTHGLLKTSRRITPSGLKPPLELFLARTKRHLQLGGLKTKQTIILCLRKASNTSHQSLSTSLIMVNCSS